MSTILIVDDEYSIVEVLSELLQEEGYNVLTAYNGQEGLARLENVIPDVVLCDIMMPVLDGRAMCQQMQRDMRYRSIPIILMSAVRPVSQLGECSYTALVEKPFDLDEVLQTLSRLLHGNAAD